MAIAAEACLEVCGTGVSLLVPLLPTTLSLPPTLFLPILPSPSPSLSSPHHLTPHLTQILRAYRVAAAKGTSVATAEEAAALEKAHADIGQKLAARSG